MKSVVCLDWLVFEIINFEMFVKIYFFEKWFFEILIKCSVINLYKICIVFFKNVNYLKEYVLDFCCIFFFVVYL